MSGSWAEIPSCGEAPSLLVTPEPVLRQAASVLEKASQYFFWQDSTISDGGIFALTRLGRYWSVVSVSAQNGIHLFKDIWEKPDTCHVLRLLTGNHLLLVRGAGCCARGTAEVQKLPGELGRAAINHFMKQFVNEQKIHKYGVVYLPENEEEEEKFFAHNAEDESPEFQYFLKCFGAPRLATELQAEGLYYGDLPLKGKPCKALHRTIHDHQNVGHVVSLLPFNPSDEQQLERKKHVGNDTVVIVFRQRGFGCSFEPEDFIVSHFVRVYLVFDLLDARKNEGTVCDVEVELSVFSRDINSNFLQFNKKQGWLGDKDFLQEISVLLINGCLSAYSEPKARERRAQGRAAAFEEFVSKPATK